MNFPNLGFLSREIPSFHAAALIIGASSLVSKLLGLFRDRLLASHFGAGDTLDAYYAAFQIPDFVYTIFLVGAASAAVLPVLLSYERKGQLEAERFIGNLLLILGGAGVFLVLASLALAPWLTHFVAPGFGGEKYQLTVTLTRLMMAGPLFLGISSILSALLQSRHRFLAFALPPIAYNVGIIIGIAVLVPVFGLPGLAYGVLLGGLLQIIVQVPTLRGLKFRLRLGFNFADPGFRTVIRTSVPRVLALGMTQITVLLLAAIASLFAVGSISVFKLATNLLYVPVGLFGASYALAMFPKLSDASLAGHGEIFREHVVLGIRNVLFWVIPIVSLAIVLRAHIVRVVLGSGAFDWQDTRLVAATLAVLAVAIISESLLPLILRAFYALGNTKSPLVWDIVGSLGTITFALLFTLLFSYHPAILERFGSLLRIGDISRPFILAVALGFSLGSLLNLILLIISLSRIFRARFGLPLLNAVRPIAGMIGGAFLAGITAYIVLIPFPALVPTNTFFGIFVQGAIAACAGFFVYAFILKLQGNAEIEGIFESFRRHLLSPARTPRVFEAEKLDNEGGK